LHFVAEEELLATCGGAYLRLKGGVLNLHAPGKITMKSGSFQLSNPASMAQKNMSPAPKRCATIAHEASNDGGAFTK
jgi:type VI secretion system secreted protein VgrG